jgi:hypothetical protein
MRKSPNLARLEEQDICVCCPYFDVLPCGDTDEHRHPVCQLGDKLGGEVVDNASVAQYCVTDYCWRDCYRFKEASGGNV